MIRCTSEGLFVWFKLSCRHNHKIMWPIEEYLFYTQIVSTQIEQKALAFNAGIVSEMTIEDYQEISDTELKYKKASTAA